MSTATAERLPVPAPVSTGTRLGQWAPLAVLMAGVFICVLDFFIVNVALPSIQHDLHASSGAIQWVVAGYGLTSAVGLVTGGRLGDLFGRRRMFATGLAIFVAASACCALAPGAGVLIAARAGQGVGFALISPSVLSLLGVIYPGPERVRAISVYGMVMGVAATTGQLLGGLLIRADVAGLGWRALFWVNVPIGIAALVASPRLVPESRSEQRRRLDLAGVALISVALLAVTLPLIQGRQEGWPAWSWACLAAAPFLLVTFVVHQGAKARRGEDPLLDPGIFVGPLRAGLVTQLVFWCQQAAAYLFLALYLQQGRGMTPLTSGAVFAVLAAGYLLTSLRAPALTVRFGRQVLLAGALTGAVGDLLLFAAVHHQGVGGSVALLFPGLFVLGAGQGLCITPLTTIVLGHARPATAGSVSGVLSTMQQVGNTVGVAVIGVVFFAAVHQGFGVAFDQALLAMAGLLLVVAVLTRMLPAGGGK